MKKAGIDTGIGVEGRLHAWFAERRVNKINERKEFFEVSIDEIESAVRAMNAEIEIVKLAEARDYRQTLALLTDPERSKIKFDN